eukprot:COSAG05_NODE_1131_length_5775_cov_33.399930_7_plen_82_part_00
MYLKEQQSAGVEEVIPRMTEEMTASFIKFGTMRSYQVEGLNWIIRCVIRLCSSSAVHYKHLRFLGRRLQVVPPGPKRHSGR